MTEPTRARRGGDPDELPAWAQSKSDEVRSLAKRYEGSHRRAAIEVAMQFGIAEEDAARIIAAAVGAKDVWTTAETTQVMAAFSQLVDVGATGEPYAPPPLPAGDLASSVQEAADREAVLAPSPVANLAAALVVAQRQAQAVAKDSENRFHRYSYASAESLIAEGRGALSAAGLALFCTGWEVLRRAESYDKQNEKAAVEGLMLVRYRLLHTSGEFLDFTAQTTIIPEKGRPADKAEATALTYSLGYFIRGLLLLPRVEKEGEPDSRPEPDEPRRRQGTQERREQKRPERTERRPRQGRPGQAPKATPADRVGMLQVALEWSWSDVELVAHELGLPKESKEWTFDHADRLRDEMRRIHAKDKAEGGGGE